MSSDSGSFSESESYQPDLHLASNTAGINLPISANNAPKNLPNERVENPPVLPSNPNYVPPQVNHNVSTPNILASNFVVSSNNSVSESSFLGSEEKIGPPPINPNLSKDLEYYRTEEAKVNNFYGTVNPVNPNPGQRRVENVVNPKENKSSGNVNKEIKPLNAQSKVKLPSLSPRNAGNNNYTGLNNGSNNNELQPLNQDLTNSVYRNEFIHYFESFSYQKITCAEKYCGKQLYNLHKLKRLKDSDMGNNKASLSKFILENYNGKKKNEIETYSIVDLYMICSLFEIAEIKPKLLRLSDIFGTISQINDNVIRNLYDGHNVAERFFDKSRKFIYENLRNNNYTEFRQFPNIN